MATLTTFWKRYVTLLKNNILNSVSAKNRVTGSRNKLFAQIIIYLLPLSFFVIIPGVIVSLLTGLYLLAVVDITALLMIAFIAFNKRMNITIRKILFISIIYLVAIALFYYLGSFGPGMLYLLAVTFFTALIFPGYNGYWSVGANVLICIFFGLAFYFGTIQLHSGNEYSLTSWIAVSSNLIVLSALVSILIPSMFNKLKRSYERFDIVSTATTDTIWEWDIKSNSMKFNTGITAMFGYSECNSVYSQAWWHERTHPDDRERVGAEFLNAFNGENKQMQIEYRFLCADGSYKYIMNRASVVISSTGAPKRMIGVIQDVSKIREYIIAIEEQNRKLREIAWIQSHKVRSPVATILGLAPLLHADVESSIDNKKIVEGISDSCQQLDGIIKEINEYTSTIEEVIPAA